MNALGLRADEGRGETAISLGWLSSKLSRGFPNGVTSLSEPQRPPVEHIDRREASGGTETS